MKKKIIITYSWWKTDKRKISADMNLTLENCAMNHIEDMMFRGCTSGELLEGDYRGWWEVTKEDVSTETKTYTRDEVVKLINDVLTSTGGENKSDIKAVMKYIGSDASYIEFDGKDLKKWIKKHVK